MTYQVLGWLDNFENNKSKERDRCSFVCVPNKQHGMGFCRIMAEADGAAIYGIWHCILGACSQQKRPREGWLTSDGRAPDGHQTGTSWAPLDLSLKFRRPEAEIKRALDVLCSESIGWVVLHGECPPSAHALPAECPPSAQEGKRREENGKKEEKEGAHSLAEIPSWKEFWDYCQMHGGPVEWYARDKFQAAGQDNWKGKSNWTVYADRIRTWWTNDGRPLKPLQKLGERPKRRDIAI